MADHTHYEVSTPLELGPPPEPQGLYAPVTIHGGLAYVAGQLSRTPEGIIPGPVDDETSAAVLDAAARACTARVLSALSHELGGLENIERIVFVRGFVHARPDFTRHSTVVDRVSLMLGETLGKRSVHARSAVGVSSLPDSGLLEVEVTAACRHLESEQSGERINAAPPAWTIRSGGAVRGRETAGG